VPPAEIIEDDGFAAFDPADDGIDFYESLEGMRVQVNDAVAVGPTSGFGEIPVVGDGGANAGVPTPRGGVIVRPSDFNPERIHLDDVLIEANTMTRVDVGDGLGTVVGVLDYSFGNFKLLVDAAPTATSGGITREVATPAGAGELSIASFNVENLDPDDEDAKFAALAGLIVDNLGAPDLLSLEEVQDDNGAANDSVVSADATYAELIAAIETAGGPTYQFRQINPVDDADGGEPGGNIRVGFLFRTDGGLAFVDRPGGGSTTATTVVTGTDGPELSFSPGRLDPTNAAFNNSRKPLAGEFTFKGARLFVIANHFNSKGGDQPLFGAFQPPARSSEVQRHQQAQIVNDFVDSILAVDEDANVVVLGDLNDFDFSDTLSIVEGGVLTNLYEELPQAERYSYVFEGNSQALDHVLVSPNAAADEASLDVIHVNAEFAERASDHDPLVARFCADATAPTLTAAASPNRLFPPNHKYVTVHVALDGADGSGEPDVEFVSATSSEPDDVPGEDDGITVNDIVQVDEDTFRLRAERNRLGSGRTYTLTYQATDACGNTTVASATVVVPIDAR
jgi:predicted extracellular nuclease